MALEYFKEATVRVPIDKAFALIEDMDRFGEWQEGFQSMEHVSGELGMPGSKYVIHYKMNKRIMEMRETLIEREPPNRVMLSFEADPGVWNSVEYIFTDKGDGTTHIRVNNVFKCKGFIAIMAFFMPFMFKQQTQKYLDAYVAWAEAQPA